MNDELELKIYKNYRAMMSKRVKSSGYPAHLRQLARKACVNRYNVSYKEVKRIVAKYDEVNGITHERPRPAPKNFWMSMSDLARVDGRH